MSYTKKTWASGDTVTSSALNNMETGIENAANLFIITLTPTAQDFSGTHDRTNAEILSAIQSGRRIVFVMDASAIGMPVLRFDANVAHNTLTAPTEFTAKGVFVESSLNLLVMVETGDDGYYVTTIFQLTPMS